MSCWRSTWRRSATASPRRPRVESDRTSWLAHSLDPSPGLAGVDLEKAVFKLKDALLRKRFTDRQIEVAYDHLTRTDHDVALTWGMATYGGAVNAVAPDATASAHRDSILTTSVTAGWENPQAEGDRTGLDPAVLPRPVRRHRWRTRSFGRHQRRFHQPP